MSSFFYVILIQIKGFATDQKRGFSYLYQLAFIGILEAVFVLDDNYYGFEFVLYVDRQLQELLC